MAAVLSGNVCATAAKQDQIRGRHLFKEGTSCRAANSFIKQCKSKARQRHNGRQPKCTMAKKARDTDALLTQMADRTMALRPFHVRSTIIRSYTVTHKDVKLTWLEIYNYVLC